MPGLMNVKFGSATIERAQALLSPDEFRRGCFQTVKRVTREGRTDVKVEVKAKTGVASKYIDRVIGSRLEIHDPEPPVGVITISYEGIPAIEYKPKISKKNGVIVQFSKDGKPTAFPHAFKARMKSGHVGIFIRKRLQVFTRDTDIQALIRAGFPEHEAKQIFSGPDGASQLVGRGIRRQKRLAFGGNFPNVSAKGIAWRLPIKELRGPSIVSFAELKEVSERIEAKLSERMDKNLNSQIDRFTK